MNPELRNEMLAELKKPFHPSDVYWKPGGLTKDQTRALAMAYADLRAYQNRLDEVCGLGWGVTYTPWGDRLICHLTIEGVTRSSTGEPDMQAEKSEIAGTAAEAQAFKRACSAFGLGRYLYQLPTQWVDYDASGRHFTESAKAKLNGMVLLHYQRTMQAQAADSETNQPAGNEATTKTSANGDKAGNSPGLSALRKQFTRLGQELYGEQWPQVCQHNVERITEGQSSNPDELTIDQMQKLVDGLKQVKRNRRTTVTTGGKGEEA